MSPDSFLAKNDKDSLKLRKNFGRAHLERDVPQLGPRIPAQTQQRLWTMLVHGQRTLLNSFAACCMAAPDCADGN